MLKWSAGIAATVLATVLTAWLTRLGVVPETNRNPAASASSAGSSSPPDGVPFTVAVRHLQDACGIGWVVPRPRGAFKEPDLGPERDWASWVREVGAVPARTGMAEFTVQGRSTAQVTLTGMKVRVTERRPALSGTHVLDGCGDRGAFRWVAAELDADPPRLTNRYEPNRILPGGAPAAERRPITFPIGSASPMPRHFSSTGMSSSATVPGWWRCRGVRRGAPGQR